MYVFTVAIETWSSPAISVLDSPFTTSSSTSRSRPVSGARLSETAGTPRGRRQNSSINRDVTLGANSP